MSTVAGDAVATDGGSAAPHEATGPSRRPRLTHVPALDGLRGMAVIAVLLFHAGYLRGGYLGVDLFFVLSGYLITSLLMVEHRDAGRIDRRAFWGRRARRILPAVLAMVAVVAVYARLRVAATDLGNVRRDGLATVFFVANWHDIAAGASYWDRGLAPSFFAHAWSLAVEEQLYLVWPFVMGWVCGRRRGRMPEAVMRWSLVVAALSAAAQLGLTALGASHERVYLGTDTRAVAVALGAVVAGWRRRRGAATASVGAVEAAAVAAAVALGVLWWSMSGTSAITYHGGLLAASILGAVVVAGAADPRSTGMATVLAVAPLRFVGRISYGLYLWHWPLFLVLTPRRTGVDGLALLALRLGVTFAFALASWYLLERPILSRRPPGWWEGRRGALSAVGAVAATALLLVACTVGAQELDTAGMGSGIARAGSSAARGAPTVVVLGDSVAASVAKPAIAEPRAFGVDVVRDTVLGCQAVWDGVHRAKGLEGDISTPRPCPPDVRSLVASERPDAVLVLYGGWTDAAFELDGRWTTPCDAAYRAALRSRLDQVLADAGSSGAPVVLAGAARSTNTFRVADNWKHTACANEVARAAAAAAGASYLDLDRWLCPHGTCREASDGLQLRSDGVHFQGPGGASAARWILGRVVALAGLDRAATSATSAPSAADRAVEAVCRSFSDIEAAEVGFTAHGLGDPSAKATLDRALRRLSPSVLARLDPEVRSDLAPVAEAGFRARLLAVLDRAAAGEGVTLDSAGPGTVASLDRAFTRMRQTC